MAKVDSINEISPIGMNDFQRQWAELGPAVLDAIRQVGESGWYILGPEVAALEQDLATCWRRRFAAGVASGTDAIEIGLRAMDCHPGDKILTSPVSAFASALAPIRLGMVPVFVDCDRFGLVDLTMAEEALQSDPSIRYFLPVHLYGHCLDMRRLAALRDRFGVRILEDAAQSIGALHEGVACGSAGECVATSLYPTKNLGALGDGGAVLSDSELLIQSVRCLRDYGQTSKYFHTHIGYNSRLDELQAAILHRVFLPHVGAWNAARRRTAERYLQGISNPLITVPGVPPGSTPCWHLFPILAADGRKKELLAWLRMQGIVAAEHYPIALMDQPVMRGVRHEEVGDCARSRDWCTREISLPIHPYLRDDEADRVVRACNGWR